MDTHNFLDYNVLPSIKHKRKIMKKVRRHSIRQLRKFSKNFKFVVLLNDLPVSQHFPFNFMVVVVAATQ